MLVTLFEYVFILRACTEHNETPALTLSYGLELPFLLHSFLFSVTHPLYMYSSLELTSSKLPQQ